MLNIELKEDSSEKLASVQGKPTKHYLFSQEFNAIVQKINEVYLAQKKKIENTRYKSTLSGENVIIPFKAAGQSHYSVTHAALVSVAGFTTAGLTTPMYEGQDVIFENQTGHDIALKDSFGVDTSFAIGADLIVPNNGKLWFRFRNNELELIDKNWFEINEVATAQNLGEFINSLDSKTNVKDTDEFVLSDGDDGLKSKKTRFLDIKNKLKGYFDTLYLSLSIFNEFVTDVFSSLDNKLDKSSTPSSVYATDAEGLQVMKPISDFTGYATQTWVTLQGYIKNVITSLGYTPENVANKSSNTSLGTSNGLYPTQNAVKTYVDNGLNSKQNKIYCLKVTTPSEYVTGTVSETEILKIEIPANTFSDNDVLNIPSLIMRKVGVAASYILRVKLSSSPTMPAGTGAETIAFASIGNTNTFTKMYRNFFINGGFIKGYPLANNTTDIANSTVALREQAFDNTITNYLYVSVSPLSSDDSFQLIGFQINNF